MTVLSAYSNYYDATDSKNLDDFSRMVEIIQDEIDDTTSEYLEQIQNSIFTAMRFCTQESFFFNEKKVVTFKTQIGKIWYGQQDGFFLEPNMVLDSVFLETHSATQIQLFYKSIELLQQQYGSHSSQGTPYFYTCSDQKIGLFPTPQDVYDVRFFCTIGYDKGKSIIQNDSPWMMYAFDLIKARAKYELYKNILKDPEGAASAFNDFQEQVKALRIETSYRRNASNILPMRF
ncbi:hypothetical protein V3565_04455 [Bartonella sp. B10]